MVAACKGWRNAVDLHHLPEGTHSLAPRPGPLVRLTFQKWCPWPDSHRHWRRFELRASALGYTGGGAHGRICTDTVRVLSALPLRWATWALGYVGKLGGALTVAADCPHNRQWHRIRFSLAS